MKTTKVQRFVARTIRRKQILNAKYNPRKISAANRARLRKSVTEFGLVTTLVWNKRTGNLVGGHRRLEEIDAIEATDDYSLTVAEIDIDPLREKALNLILNNPAAQGEYDDKLLAKVLHELDGKIDLELTGFDENEVERMLGETILPDAQFPITAKLHERYDFVVIFTENESDFAFLQNLCGVQTERSYKKTGIGIGRAVPFKRFLKSIRENRHSIDVQGGNDDDASAHPERRRVRPGKSAR
jgi:hypothetical protein